MHHVGCRQFVGLLICRFPVCKIVMMSRNKNICTRTSFIFFSSVSITMTTATATWINIGNKNNQTKGTIVEAVGKRHHADQIPQREINFLFVVSFFPTLTNCNRGVQNDMRVTYTYKQKIAFCDLLFSLWLSCLFPIIEQY